MNCQNVDIIQLISNLAAVYLFTHDTENGNYNMQMKACIEVFAKQKSPQSTDLAASDVSWAYACIYFFSE